MKKELTFKTEIAVIGAGPAGLSAAITAARAGRRVLLLEKNGYLGGNATLGLPLLGFLDLDGRRIVGGIAQELGISEGYLHRVFKAAAGCSVLEYLNRKRVTVAIDLVDNRGLSLKDAAFNVGIEDPAYMSRLFKKVTGLSFREYFREKRVSSYF